MPWDRKRYRNGKLYIEIDDEGRMIVQNSVVRGRYKNEEDARAYTFKADAIRNLDGSVPTRTDSSSTGTSAPRSKPSKSSKTAPKRVGQRNVSNLNNDSPIAQLPLAGEEFIEIYTDGACTGNPGPAGLGVLLRWGPYHREVFQYIGISTNNVAELMAIKVALETVRDPQRLPVKIYTDSSYALGVVTGKYKAKANRELILGIREQMKAFKDLEILKVAGHSGHPLNDRADELARRAIEDAKAS